MTQQELITKIKNTIKNNGNKAISGDILQGILTDIVNLTPPIVNLELNKETFTGVTIAGKKQYRKLYQIGISAITSILNAISSFDYTERFYAFPSKPKSAEDITKTTNYYMFKQDSNSQLYDSIESEIPELSELSTAKLTFIVDAGSEEELSNLNLEFTVCIYSGNLQTSNRKFAVVQGCSASDMSYIVSTISVISTGTCNVIVEYLK